MLDHRLDGLPRGAAVAAAEERAGSAAEEQGLRLVRVPRLDVPRLLPGEAALLGEANALGTLPGLAEVGRAVRGRAVDPVVRGRVDDAGARVAHSVEDFPAGEVGPLDAPVAPGFVAGEDEQTLAGADEDGDSHRVTSLREKRSEMTTLTDKQRKFLEQPFVGTLTTLRDDGSPHSTIVWVDTDTDTDEVLFNTAAGRAKERHLRRDPRV